MARKKKKTEETTSGMSGQTRAVIFGVVALVCGVLAVFVISMAIQNYEAKIAAAQAPEDTVLAVIAARDLYQGIVITEEDLLQIPVPPEFLPGGTEELVYLLPEHLVGRVPKERILANEFIREVRLADPENGTGLNALIPRGMRAISMQLKDGAALSGFLNSGDYVDVVVTIKPDEGDSSDQITETRTLVQAVYVLAVNDKTGKTEGTSPEAARDAKKKKKKTKKKRIKPSVTLAVTPEQAEGLAHASRQGEITLTLRNQQDLQFEELEAADTSKLLGEEAEPEPEVKKKRPVKAIAAPEPVEEEPEEPGLIIIRGNK